MKIKVYDFNEMKNTYIDFDTLVLNYATTLKHDYSDLDEFFTLHFISKKHYTPFKNDLERLEAKHDL